MLTACTAGAVETFAGDMTIEKQLTPFLGLEYVAELMPQERDVSDVFRVNENADTRKTDCSSVFQFSDGTRKAGHSEIIANVFADTEKLYERPDD